MPFTDIDRDVNRAVKAIVEISKLHSDDWKRDFFAELDEKLKPMRPENENGSGQT